MIFAKKSLQNGLAGHPQKNPYFSRPFPEIDFGVHFGRPLDPFGLPFGALWFPCGSIWLPFGPLLAPFGSLFAPFGSFLLTLGVHLLTLGVSWRRFQSLSDFFNENLIENNVLLCFS